MGDRPLPPGGEGVEQRVEEFGNGGFGDEPEGQAGESDAELGGSDTVVEPLDRGHQGLRPRSAVVDQFFHPGLTHRDKGELGGDEEPVHRHQDRDG